MIAAVRDVIAACVASGSRQNVSGSMSAKTGSAPTRRTAFAEAAKENDGTTTSSPRPIPSARKVSCSAEVPEFTAMQWRPATMSANSASNAATSGPCTTDPLRNTRTAAAISSSPITGRAAGTNPSLLLDNRRSPPGHAPEYVTASTCTGVGRIQPEDIEPMICRSQGAAEYSVSRAPPAAQCAGGGSGYALPTVFRWPMACP